MDIRSISFNSLTFDEINSLEHGVYITGEAVYNAPERAIEMVAIPGRNGDLAIDQERFENIEVKYPAGIFASTQEEFAQKMRKFRNLLVSRFFYVKITDTYHPDEYRLGLYKSGLEVDPVAYSSAGEFDIVFNCKPQRFLTSGEEALELYATDVLTDHNLIPITTETGAEIEVNYAKESFENPTDNESAPLIIAPKPGTLRIGNQNITVAGDGSKPVYIDSDMLEIYTVDAGGAIANASDLVSFEPNAFPKIEAGENSFATSIPGLQIIPRWWIL